MGLKRTSHDAVYDGQYHLVWAPKYRKWILRGDVREHVRSLFYQIAEDFDFAIEEMEIAEDHVHVFLSFPPRYSIAKSVGILKSISASRVFQDHPEVKNELWGGEFWEDGYFARTVGDRVTSEVIKKYIRYHREEKEGPQQLDLFGLGS